ncbi:phosphoribosyltransferase family protein [Ohtaekwangia koreensis]|uniref:Predicted phosphoribosyltransferase n=1 Tax=Ohtaekwangia koreensis TaxID=688867 RepID=A0A1T5M5Q2_9BACT|nr:phosphoribosyltransferase family protein [Ohtaekwangia koreensis]SKC83465.1 Predicted phosphoribosyltransferase [Ohtaekwangia koreensis]
MQVQTINTPWRDRREAGYLLGHKLDIYRYHDSVVVGIPHGGVEVASAIAEVLHIPLDVMPCRTIPHPADSRRSIGSISGDEVYIHDCSHTIPQDYISHQIATFRWEMMCENRQYHRTTGKPISLKHRQVILVNDELVCSDSMITCLRSIRNQNPSKIIVAVPVISVEAADVIGAEADEVIFLKKEVFPEFQDVYFVNNPTVDNVGIENLLEVSKYIR